MPETDYFVHVRSDDSSSLFPSNTPFSFTVKLPVELAFQGDWFCSLVDILHPAPEGSQPKTLTVKCDFVRTSIVDGTTDTVLRRFFTRGFDGHMFADARYMRVLGTSARQLAFSITGDNIKHALQGDGVTVLTVRFRRSQ